MSQFVDFNFFFFFFDALRSDVTVSQVRWEMDASRTKRRLQSKREESQESGHPLAVN